MHLLEPGGDVDLAAAQLRVDARRLVDDQPCEDHRGDHDGDGDDPERQRRREVAPPRPAPQQPLEERLEEERGERRPEERAEEARDDRGQRDRDRGDEEDQPAILDAPGFDGHDA